MGLFIENLKSLLDRYGLSGDVLKCEPFGFGHIHKSYLLECSNGDYILQRINDLIFSPVPSLMSNISHVLRHIENSRSIMLSNENLPQEVKSVLDNLRTFNILPTEDGSLAINWEGSWWRIYTKVDNAVAYNIAPDVGYIKSAALLCGVFLRLFRTVPFEHEQELIDILPEFQNVVLRVDRLGIVFKNIKEGRVQISDRIVRAYDTIMSLREIVDRVWQIEAPRYVVHNDLKLNNVLFDVNSGAACSVVDLDTCGVGYLFYDFGDFLRSACATCDEDKVAEMGVDVESLRVAVEAFGVGIDFGSLSLIEKQSCVYAPVAVALALASRFLTDHLEGDRYFKTRFRGHNLQRAEAQIVLAQSFLKHTGLLESMILG